MNNDDSNMRGCTGIILAIALFLVLLYMAFAPELAGWVRRLLN